MPERVRDAAKSLMYAFICTAATAATAQTPVGVPAGNKLDPFLS